MTDEDLLEELEEKADRIFEEMGLDPDGPLDQFNYESGREFGKRLIELWPADPKIRERVFTQIAREALDMFQSTFPASFDPDTFELQSYFLGPLVSKFVSGHGLTVPQLALLAGVTPEHVYRLKRAGLSILFEEEEPIVRSGVNRRFSGLDGRQTHLSVDFTGILTKKWPEPASFLQRFLLGIFDGARTWLESPEYRRPLEASLKRTLSNFFTDPVLGDVFDGMFAAVKRITQRLRDEILIMKSEKDTAQRLLHMIVELESHRPEILSAFAQAGAAIANESNALPAGVEP